MTDPHNNPDPPEVSPFTPIGTGAETLEDVEKATLHATEMHKIRYWELMHVFADGFHRYPTRSERCMISRAAWHLWTGRAVGLRNINGFLQVIYG